MSARATIPGMAEAMDTAISQEDKSRSTTNVLEDEPPSPKVVPGPPKISPYAKFFAPPTIPAQETSSEPEPGEQKVDKTGENQAQSNAATPLDPRKLNQTLAPLPLPPTSETPTSPPLRSPEPGQNIESAYLDTDIISEAPSHPTIAETGVFASRVGGSGPGPLSGQLKRAESNGERKIIKLGSFGGEGLEAKPIKKEED